MAWIMRAKYHGIGNAESNESFGASKLNTISSATLSRAQNVHTDIGSTNTFAQTGQIRVADWIYLKCSLLKMLAAFGMSALSQRVSLNLSLRLSPVTRIEKRN